LDFALSEEHRMLNNPVARFVKEQVAPRRACFLTGRPFN
jgi:hypothetical protein